MFLSILVSTYVALSPVNSTYPAVLDCIVSHESGGKQFNADGSPLWSPVDTDGLRDVGIMQIHASWIPLAQKMGLDVVNNEKDNIEFGIWLMNKYGLTQWSTYKSCKGGEET